MKCVLIAIGEDPKPGVHTGTDDFPDWVVAHLAEQGIDNVYAPCFTRADLERHAADADVVWMYSGSRILTADNLAVLKRCGVVLKVGAGVDNIDVEAATRLGIIVANTPWVVVEPVAEHTIALMLAAARRIPQQNVLIRRGTWSAQGIRPTRTLVGATIGTIGYGRVARLMAERLGGFRACLLTYDPYVSSEAANAAGAIKVSLDELLAESDYVTINCHLTPETRGLIGEAQLRAMKPSAILVNTARGPIVDEAALYRALREGWIAGAALDVLAEEPPRSDNPLLQLDNVILTPHSASTTSESPDNGWRALCDVLQTLAHGQRPPSVVNPDVDARWNPAHVGG